MINHNLDYIWETMIYPQVDKSQRIYKIKEKAYKISHIVVIVVAIVFACTKTYLITENPGLSLSLFIPNMLLLCFEGKTLYAYKKEIKKFYNIFFEGHNITHSIKNSDYFTETDILSTNIFNATHMTINDIFTGTYNNIPFQLAEINLTKASRRCNTSVFSGSILVLNSFFKTNSIIIYPKTNYKEKQSNNYSREMGSFFKKLSGIGKFKSIVITKEQIFIFLSSPLYNYELIDYGNIKKEQFENVIEEVFKKLEIIDKLNIKENYRFPQTNLNTSLTYDKDKKRSNRLLVISLFFFSIFILQTIALVYFIIGNHKPDNIISFLIMLSCLVMCPIILIGTNLYSKRHIKK